MSGTSRSSSSGDIARSIAVIGLILVALFGIGRLVTVEPDHPTTPVDYRSAAESSRTVADFDLLAPTSLPEGWHATSVRFDKGAWHLGVLTADKEYVGLEQVREPERRTVERFAPRSTSDGAAEIEGTTWSRRSGPDGDSTYVRRDGDMTVLVTGSAPRAQIERYVASLSSSS
jgi:hypothetical protein